jgi:hypothetical protein
MKVPLSYQLGRVVNSEPPGEPQVYGTAKEMVKTLSVFGQVGTIPRSLALTPLSSALGHLP